MFAHYSPASGRPDAPEYYQTVSVTLKENAKGTTIEEFCQSKVEMAGPQQSRNVRLPLLFSSVVVGDLCRQIREDEPAQVGGLAPSRVVRDLG